MNHKLLKILTFHRQIIAQRVPCHWLNFSYSFVFCHIFLYKRRILKVVLRFSFILILLLKSSWNTNLQNGRKTTICSGSCLINKTNPFGRIENKVKLKLKKIINTIQNKCCFCSPMETIPPGWGPHSPPGDSPPPSQASAHPGLPSNSQITSRFHSMGKLYFPLLWFSLVYPQYSLVSILAQKACIHTCTALWSHPLIFRLIPSNSTSQMVAICQ